MTASIQELAYHKTPLGELTLRRRLEPRAAGREIFEVKLGDDYLMSSLFVDGERELARLGLKDLGGDLNVVVGGLGLGYTAAAALEHENVGSLLVVDIFPEVIAWHEQGLVPLGAELTADERCRMIAGDFFAMAKTGFDPSGESRSFDAILLDIDHSPRHYLAPTNAEFYSVDGLSSVCKQLKPNGAFALWSTELPDAEFIALLTRVFGEAEAHTIEFTSPYNAEISHNSVYVAHSVAAK